MPGTASTTRVATPVAGAGPVGPLAPAAPVVPPATMPAGTAGGIVAAAPTRFVLPPVPGMPFARRFAADAGAMFPDDIVAWLAKIRDTAPSAQDLAFTEWHLSRIPNEETRRDFLTVLGTHNPTLAVELASSLRIKCQERMTLALSALDGNAFLVAEKLSTFNLTRAQHLELIKGAATRVDMYTLRNILVGLFQFHGMLTASEQLACIEYLLQPAVVTHAPSAPTVQLAVDIYRQLLPPGEARTHLDRHAIAKDPAGFLAAHFDNPQHPYTMGSIAEVRRDLTAIADADPSILPHRFMAAAWDRVARLEAGLAILRAAMKRHLTGSLVPDDSSAILADVMGYDTAAIRGIACSDNTLGDLYELSLDIELYCEHPPFAGIAIDPRLWHGEGLKRFIALLGRLRDLLHLRGNGGAAWRELVDELHLAATGITVENATPLGQRIAQQIEQQIVAVLQHAFQTAKISFTYEQFTALHEAWGDLTPIYTLLARFQGKPAWRKEIPVLAAVFEASLQGRFAGLKFAGQAAERQIGFLSAAQRAEWQRPRSRLTIATRPPKAAVHAERGATLRDILDNNLALHTIHLHVDKAIPSAESYALIDTIAEAKHPPQELLLQLLAAPPLNCLPQHKATMHLAACAIGGILVYREEYLEEVVRLARFLLENRVSLQLTPQIVDDLDAVVTCCRLPMDGAEEHLVFTTTSWDPRFLLTIGDLVHTSSCLNYRTGSHIDALLGYVLDAGVQGIASFILAPRHFARPQDYARLRAAVAAGVPIAQRFDGNRCIAHFRFEDEGGAHEIMTGPIEQAHLRHILKIGSTATSRPGLKRERAYRQLHPAIFTMQREVEAITAELAAALGAVRDQPTTMPASRNPGGTYSDAGCGIRRTEYLIP